MILKSFEFQGDFDFDFQITTSKLIWILILNHLYLGDLILILKLSTYDDFAHLCLKFVESICMFKVFYISSSRPNVCMSLNFNKESIIAQEI